ncbi:MAG: hypothetical protein NTV00_08415, partial [Methylococcales bacterium]|nr:hypothetical protein [Methylococcales bacterium]
AVVFCCFFDGFAFIKIMTYEITDYHIIPLIYNDYLVNLCIGLQDLGITKNNPPVWIFIDVCLR